MGWIHPDITIRVARPGVRWFAFVVAFAVAFGLSMWSAAPRVPISSAGDFSAGDTVIANSGGTLHLYPCFRVGGGHVHLPDPASWYDANDCGRAGAFFVYAQTTVWVRLYGSSRVDTSAFRVPAGASFAAPIDVDSIWVWNWNTSGTCQVSWGFYR